jgi:RimJ/RimL family protein N-acetyltransferase
VVDVENRGRKLEKVWIIVQEKWQAACEILAKNLEQEQIGCEFLEGRPKQIRCEFLDEMSGQIRCEFLEGRPKQIRCEFPDELTEQNCCEFLEGRSKQVLSSDETFSDGAETSDGMTSFGITEKGVLENDFSRMLLLTDQSALAHTFAEYGISCVGCADPEEGYFEGAGLVTDRPDLLEVRELEEYLFHCQGWPVTIAVTPRLILREIAEEDIGRLQKIGSQSGMQYLQASLEEDFFGTDRMRAYIAQAYRLQGFGLWSVWKRTVYEAADSSAGGVYKVKETDDSSDRRACEGKEVAASPEKGEQEGDLIGLCGLSEYVREDGEEVLELQYMLDEKFQRKGYAQEMCRAALAYAAERTDYGEIFVRIHRENRPSLALAEKLGFQAVERLRKEAVEKTGLGVDLENDVSYTLQRSL